MRLHWHRRDLRIADNPGVAAAATEDPVVPVFVVDPAVLEHAASPRMQFLLDALDSLKAAYRDRGSDLVVERGDPSAVLPGIANDVGAERVTWGADYSGLSKRRDDAVRAALTDAGIGHETLVDAVLHEPGEITTNAGDHYSVYSYFWKKWCDRDKTPPYLVSDDAAFAEVDGDPVPSMEDLGFEAPTAAVPDASTDAARERLATFLADRAGSYDDERDDPAADATSRLSPHLTFGTIGIREVYSATVEAKAVAEPEAAAGIEEFQSQLAWREFYLQVLDANPSMVARNLKTFANEIDWRDPATDDAAAEDLNAWKAGETGVPIVDAGMRQLREEAWMHNRLRMIVAAFLTKDLLIDWRHGYRHFREHLVDHDAANDAGGWQWAASTGTDAVPYFRVFNPWTQAERFDPHATFVERYVPELRDLDAETILGWNGLDEEERTELAPEYPAPIVDHAAARERAIETFEAARGDE